MTFQALKIWREKIQGLSRTRKSPELYIKTQCKVSRINAAGLLQAGCLTVTQPKASQDNSTINK